MIGTWKNAPSRRIYDTGTAPGRFASLNLELARRRLRALDSATNLGDLGNLKSVGLHKLKGDRRGQWAIRANGPWRICFFWNGGNAFEVEITDYHKG